MDGKNSMSEDDIGQNQQIGSEFHPGTKQKQINGGSLPPTPTTTRNTRFLAQCILDIFSQTNDALLKSQEQNEQRLQQGLHQSHQHYTELIMKNQAEAIAQVNKLGKSPMQDIPADDDVMMDDAMDVLDVADMKATTGVESSSRNSSLKEVPTWNNTVTKNAPAARKTEELAPIDLPDIMEEPDMEFSSWISSLNEVPAWNNKKPTAHFELTTQASSTKMKMAPVTTVVEKKKATITPVFATQQLEPIRKNIMALDDKCFKGHRWQFDLSTHLLAIEDSIQTERHFNGKDPVALKHFVVGLRDATSDTIFHLGLGLPENLDEIFDITIPYFTVHTIEEGTMTDPTEFGLSNDSNIKTTIENGGMYSWTKVEDHPLNVMVLTSNVRLDDESVSKMSNHDRQIAEAGVVLFPPRLDFNGMNPLENFNLKIDGVPRPLSIDLDIFQHARRAALDAMIHEGILENPSWATGREDEELCWEIWSDIFLNLKDPKVWADGILHPAFVADIVDYYFEELASFDDQSQIKIIRNHAKEALLKFHEERLKTTKACLELKIKHYKIFPENEILKTHFLKRKSLPHMNEIIEVEALGCFPQPAGPPRIARQSYFNASDSEEEFDEEYATHSTVHGGTAGRASSPYYFW